MRLSAVLGLTVETESGDRLGHVHDLRGELGRSSLRITGLVVGSRGAVERLGIGAPTWAARVRLGDVIPWSRVVRVDRRGVVVKDGTEPGNGGHA
jgi:sporulation protein YlmC with PRC-barrel domain